MAAPSVIWFRRDLRVTDHPALAAAIAAGGDVVALFVDDPALRGGSGAPRLAYLHDCLESLDASLSGSLVVRTGDPVDVVAAVADEVGAGEVFVSRDHAPYGRRRDERVAARLAASDRRLQGIGSNYVVTPGTVRKDDGDPYSVFTPFFRQWRAEIDAHADRCAPVEVDLDAASWVSLPSDGIPERPSTDVELPPAGEAAAHERWAAFVGDGLDHYDDMRNRPDIDGTSRLSPHLKWGTVHPRTLVADVRDLGDLGPDAHRIYVSELAWREFYADVLFHRPETAWSNLNTRMDAMAVDTDAAATDRFERWRSGTTGFPIVDAAMRQLDQTGWMHNRLRMVVASFLVKDLHLPWQWGAEHFMERLVDGDLASNNHGWQWTAGTGTDAAPYFRVFNPWSQQERHDPDGTYVAEWVPELGTDDELEPMVDHAVEREEALARYEAVKGS